MFSSQVKAALAEDSNEQGGSKLILHGGVDRDSLANGKGMALTH